MTDTTRSLIPEPPETWRPMDTAPRDETMIVGDYDGAEVRVRWYEYRSGAFGPGWVNVENGLEADDPDAWRPAAKTAVVR